MGAVSPMPSCIVAASREVDTAVQNTIPLTCAARRSNDGSMGTVGSTTTVKKSSAQVSTLVEGETIVLQLETGTYFSLNEVGVVVWEALDQLRTVEELKDKVLSE